MVKGKIRNYVKISKLTPLSKDMIRCFFVLNEGVFRLQD